MSELTREEWDALDSQLRLCGTFPVSDSDSEALKQRTEYLIARQGLDRLKPLPDAASAVAAWHRGNMTHNALWKALNDYQNAAGDRYSTGDVDYLAIIRHMTDRHQIIVEFSP